MVTAREQARLALDRLRRDRNIERARFVYQAAREANLSVHIDDANVSVWAPLSKDVATQVACERSFQDAIQGSLNTIRLVARERRRRKLRHVH
jgi:hypothetical protein